MLDDPAGTLYPCLYYDDALGAIDWLERAFGFQRRLVVPGDETRPVAHAELVLGSGCIMVGSSNLDLVATAAVLPGPGETVMGRDYAEHPGGKGLNQAVAAARAGARTVFLSAVGDDTAGAGLLAVMHRDGIDTSKVAVYLLTGEYDFSCPPMLTQMLADDIKGSRFQVIEGMGHFPMSEDPARFREYILPVLDEIRHGVSP